ncbi:hypothetical protein BG004_000343 [Podila humilis]|nr:hypothetical protein BG004_000343 [Podila humilis]
MSTLVEYLQNALAQKTVARAIGVYVLYLLFKYRSTAVGATIRSDIPGPRGLPLLGNVIDVLRIPRNQLTQHNVKMHRKYGSVWTYTVPKIGRIIRFNDPDILEHVLKTNFWAYEKGAMLGDTVRDLLGHGIFAVDGHQWKWQRKMASHVFTVKAFRTYTSEVFLEEGQKVLDYLDQIAEGGQVVDLQEVFYKFTLDSFGQVSFGQTFGCLDDPEKEIEFASAFDRMNTAVFKRLFDASWRVREYVTGLNKQIENDKTIVQDFARSIIRKRRAEGYHKPQKDLLQLFMDMQDDEGKPVSETALVDLTLNFIIAALRIYPSVPKNIKVCVQDDVWPNGTKIYKGECVVWHPWAMGRNEAIWGKDANEYNPARWMTGDKPSSSKFPAFHTGPRTCLGQQFATIEAITIMTLLFHRFTFELVDPNTEPEYSPSLTLPMTHGLPVRVKRRL